MWCGFRNRSRRFRIVAAVRKSRRSTHPFLSASSPYRSGKWRSTPAIVRPTTSTSSSLSRNFAWLPHIGQISSRKKPWERHSFSMERCADNRPRIKGFARGPHEVGGPLRAQAPRLVPEKRLEGPKEGLRERLPMEVDEPCARRPRDRLLHRVPVRGLERVRGDEVPERHASRQGDVRDPGDVVAAANADRDGIP